MPRASLVGRWRIIEMDLWDRDAMDLVGPATIEFARGGTGSFSFIAVQANLDLRESADDDGRVHFTFEGFDEGDQVSGRGWAVLRDDGTLVGHLFFHLGDHSGFVAVRRHHS
jgi:hypothetical protein